MLDLKAKLAAAGVVSAKQVKDFDEKEAKAKDTKRRKAANPQKHHEPRKHKGGGKPQSSNKRGGGARKKKPGASKTATDAATLKTLNRGEAYGRIRKVVEHSRLDDKEQTIPGVDDQTFNFVTAQGRIGKLYVTAATAQKLSEGKAGISAFMSHHGLSHCVLPRDIALDFAQVFPLWLRHLQGHEAAGQIEAPPEEADPQATEPLVDAKAESSSDKASAEPASDKADSEVLSDKADSEVLSDKADSEFSSDKADSEVLSDKADPEVSSDKASADSSQDKLNS